MAPRTPHKTSLQIDITINNLNAKWSLKIPRLHGVEAEKAKGISSDTAARCSLAIRFLCWKSAKLEGVLDEFSERAKIALSAWVYKPSQELGTLLSLPKTKSFARRDVLTKQGGRLTSEQHEQLLQILLDILNEEIRLTNDSDVYERTPSRQSTQNISAAASRSASFIGTSSLSRSSSTTSKTVTITAANSVMIRTSPKRRVSPTDRQSNTAKKQKRQSTLLDSWPAQDANIAQSHMSPSATPSLRSNIDNALPEGLIASFETTISKASEKIFTDDEAQYNTSADTSMVSSFSDDGQDLLPTQDVNEFMNDASFSSNLEAADSVSSFSLDDLAGTGPFKKPTYNLPSDLPFWLKYDAHRLALLTRQPVRQLYEDIKTVCRCPEPTYEDFWRAAKDVCQAYGPDKMAVSELRDWTYKNNMYENANDGTSTYFKGKIELQAKGDLLEFKLNPAIVDKSCRFHRHFGADRFMTIVMPYFTTDSLPKDIRKRYKDKDNGIHKLIVSWIAGCDHYIAGRTWRAFFLEPEKTQSKKRREIEGRHQKLHLFAIDGTDFGPYEGCSAGRQHHPVPLLKFLDWHTPLEFNLRSSDLKLFARFSLGLSKTSSTIELFPSEFYHLEDTSDGEVMNDGCALMSLELARAIWKQHGDPAFELPSAFQGRIGGAKGLWVVDFLDTRAPLGNRGYWIEVSDSQLKIKPHPKDRLDADATQRTFELLKYSKPCDVGHLNSQLVNILDKRGVSRQTLRQALLNDVREYIDGARDAMTDGRKLRGWMQKFHPIHRSDEKTAFRGGLPGSKEEEVCLFLESGFEAGDSLHIRKAMKILMTQELNAYMEKFRITLKHSTNVFCIPDPYGVLEPDEVYLGFSHEWENPKTGLMDTSLDGIDVLVARNPAHLPSDIQKRRAVYKRALRHMKNVVVFSTKGETPTAALLSGGDYDGDTITVIWDPEITSSFSSIGKPMLPSEKECGLENKSRQLSTIFQAREPADIEVDSFFEGCISFNAYPDLLGICTGTFEKLVYNTEDISTPDAVMLAALAGYLVDSSKQGWFLSNAVWADLRKRTCGNLQWRPPAYKEDDPKPWRQGNGKPGQCINILDFLKFDVAQKEKDETLTAFANTFAVRDDYDIKLGALWRHEQSRGQPGSNDSEREAIEAVLKKLRSDLESVVTFWARKLHRLDEGSEEFSDIAAIASDRVRDIVPLDIDCNIVRDYKRDGTDKGSRWSLLRASGMYYKFFGNSVVWYTVGDELCRLRARSKGITREMIPSMHYVLKADVKLIDKLCGPRSDANETDENTE